MKIAALIPAFNEARTIGTVVRGIAPAVDAVLVGSVQEAAHRFGMTEVFVGVILVAVIGNAAEHSTAVLVAMKDKMDLAMKIGRAHV